LYRGSVSFWGGVLDRCGRMVAGSSGRNDPAIDMAPDPAARHFVSLVGRMTRFDATIE
jgi:hypothetical protein